MLFTNPHIIRCHVQQLVDEDSAGASGTQVGRLHGSSIVTSLFADNDQTGITHLLSAPSADIATYFATLAKSYAVPFLVALRNGLADAAGDRVAAYAVGLLTELDPAELAREIAALRRGVDEGFMAGLAELFRDAAEKDTDAPTAEEPRTEPGKHRTSPEAL
jgi:hypothetical protein